MAIEGPLRELGVSDLLQLLSLSRRTGQLRADQGSGMLSLSVTLDAGVIVGVTGLPPELRIGRLAVLWERTTEDELGRALARQTSSPGRRLGEILLEQDAISELDVRRLVEFQIGEAIFEMLRWEDGHLAFADGPAQPDRLVDVRVSTDSVLLESARRLDELGEITGGDPRLDPIPRLADQQEGRSAALSLRSLEWAVLAEVDGARTLLEISRTVGRSQLDVARALQALQDAGVVELGGASPVPGAAAAPASEMAVKGEEDGEREVRTGWALIESGDLDEAGARVDALLRRSPDSAVVHTLKGVLEMKRGAAGDGITHFDRAIELDPLHGAAYFHLATALIRRGELLRARREIDTFLSLSASADPLRPRAKELLAGLTMTLAALAEDPV